MASEETMLAITRTICRNGHKAVRINFTHFGSLYLPVILRVLDNTERVNPQIINSKLATYHDRIPKGLRELFDGNVLLEGFQSFGFGLKRYLSSPAVT